MVRLLCALTVRTLRLAAAAAASTYLLSVYVRVCVCVFFCVSAFMPCINVTMHHLCHLLSAHKCKIWVLLTQRLCPDRRAPRATPSGPVTLLPCLSTFCLCPQHTTHTNYLTLPLTEIESHSASCGRLSRPTFSLLPVLANEFL